MGRESFLIWINDHRYIAVSFTTVSGEVVSFVVRLMACGPDGDRILSRFDTAHHLAHHDILTAAGNLRQEKWYSHLTFNEALKYAIDHFKIHHEEYPG